MDQDDQKQPEGTDQGQNAAEESAPASGDAPTSPQGDGDAGEKAE